MNTKEKTQKVQFAWLIEYRMEGSIDYWTCPNYHPDASKAIRFSRKEDAERVVKEFKDTTDIQGRYVHFLCAPSHEIVIAEHGFYDNSKKTE